MQGEVRDVQQDADVPQVTTDVFFTEPFKWFEVKVFVEPEI